MNHVVDRVADTVVIAGTAVYAGFLPIDLEAWMLTASLAGAATYYFTKSIPQILEIWERYFKK